MFIYVFLFIRFWQSNVYTKNCIKKILMTLHQCFLIKKVMVNVHQCETKVLTRFNIFFSLMLRASDPNLSNHLKKKQFRKFIHMLLKKSYRRTDAIFFITVFQSVLAVKKILIWIQGYILCVSIIPLPLEIHLFLSINEAGGAIYFKVYNQKRLNLFFLLSPAAYLSPDP